MAGSGNILAGRGLLREGFVGGKGRGVGGGAHDGAGGGRSDFAGSGSSLAHLVRADGANHLGGAGRAVLGPGIGRRAVAVAGSGNLAVAALPGIQIVDLLRARLVGEELAAIGAGPIGLEAVLGAGRVLCVGLRQIVMVVRRDHARNGSRDRGVAVSDGHIRGEGTGRGVGGRGLVGIGNAYRKLGILRLQRADGVVHRGLDAGGQIFLGVIGSGAEIVSIACGFNGRLGLAGGIHRIIGVKQGDLTRPFNRVGDRGSHNGPIVCGELLQARAGIHVDVFHQRIGILVGQRLGKGQGGGVAADVIAQVAAVALQAADGVRGQIDGAGNGLHIVGQQRKVRAALVLNGGAHGDHAIEMLAGRMLIHAGLTVGNLTVGIREVVAVIAGRLRDQIFDDLFIVGLAGIELGIVADLLPGHVQVRLGGRRVAVHIVQHIAKALVQGVAVGDIAAVVAFLALIIVAVVRAGAGTGLGCIGLQGNHIPVHIAQRCGGGHIAGAGPGAVSLGDPQAVRRGALQGLVIVPGHGLAAAVAQADDNVLVGISVLQHLLQAADRHGGAVGGVFGIAVADQQDAVGVVHVDRGGHTLKGGFLLGLAHVGDFQGSVLEGVVRHRGGLADADGGQAAVFIRHAEGLGADALQRVRQGHFGNVGVIEEGVGGDGLHAVADHDLRDILDLLSRQQARGHIGRRRHQGIVDGVDVQRAARDLIGDAVYIIRLLVHGVLIRQVLELDAVRSGPGPDLAVLAVVVHGEGDVIRVGEEVAAAGHLDRGIRIGEIHLVEFRTRVAVLAEEGADGCHGAGELNGVALIAQLRIVAILGAVQLGAVRQGPVEGVAADGRQAGRQNDLFQGREEFKRAVADGGDPLVDDQLRHPAAVAVLAADLLGLGPIVAVLVDLRLARAVGEGRGGPGAAELHHQVVIVLIDHINDVVGEDGFLENVIRVPFALGGDGAVIAGGQDLTVSFGSGRAVFPGVFGDRNALLINEPQGSTAFLRKSEGAVTHGLDRAGQRHRAGQAGLVIERARADGGDAVPNGQAGDRLVRPGSRIACFARGIIRDRARAGQGQLSAVEDPVNAAVGNVAFRVGAQINVIIAEALDGRNGGGIRQTALDGDGRAGIAERILAEGQGGHSLRQQHRGDGVAHCVRAVTAEGISVDSGDLGGQIAEIQHAVRTRKGGGHKGVAVDGGRGPVCKVRVRQIIELCEGGRCAGKVADVRFIGHLGDQAAEEQIALAVAAPSVAQGQVGLAHGLALRLVGGGIGARFHRGDPGAVRILEADIIGIVAGVRCVEHHGAILFRRGAEPLIKLLGNIPAGDRLLRDRLDLRIGRGMSIFHGLDQGVDLVRQRVLPQPDRVCVTVVRNAGIAIHVVSPRAVIIVAVVP